MIAFLDSSMFWRPIRREERAMAQPPRLSRFTRILASELLEIEVERALDRFLFRARAGDVPADEAARLERAARRRLLRLEIIEADRATLRRAREPFGAPMATLDALHLAAVLEWRAANPAETVALVSGDGEMRDAASRYGVPLFPK